MMRRLSLSVLLSLLVAIPPGCDGGGMCRDVFPNAWVHDVVYDRDAYALYVVLHHDLSYCTGSDENRYSHERITVDLITGEAAFEQRYSDDSTLYSAPEVCCALYSDGNFGNASLCTGCELSLGAGVYGFRFSIPEEWGSAMVLEVTEQEQPLVTIDIGYDRSAVR